MTDFESFRDGALELAEMNKKLMDAKEELESEFNKSNTDGDLDDVLIAIREITDHDDYICDIIFELQRTEDSLNPTLYEQEG